MTQTLVKSADAVADLAALLLDARKSRTCIPTLSPALALQDVTEAYAVQDRVLAALLASQGAVRGWKVGAPTPDAEPSCAPLHAATLFEGDTVLPEGLCRFFGVEAEIVYRFDRALPARGAPWTEAEVRDAIGSAHTAIEIFDSRFCKTGSQQPLVHLADQGNHGALIVGEGMTDWASLVPVEETVELRVDGAVVQEHRGGNSAGDPIRMLVWLANHAAARGLPFQEGTLVTSGSTTGTLFVEAGVTARAKIGALPAVTVTIPALRT